MSSTQLDSIDDILDMGVDINDSISRDEFDGAGTSSTDHWHEPEYTGKIDYRIRQLSYSSLLSLHSCPRKFELYKRRTTHKLEEFLKSTVTFAFGHVVGEAVQNVLQGLPEQEVIWKMFLGWKLDLMAESPDPKDKKSFWLAVIAVQKFIAMRKAGFLNDYDLVYVDGIPACELSFCVTLPDGFRLRGFVDAVLRHKTSGKVVVLECKTTKSATLNPATYKNSSQAIGYSVVLDNLFPDLNSYEVLYLVYQTNGMEWNVLPFTKLYSQRAEWIQDLLLDVEFIKMCEEREFYPKRGESCYSFFRECEYINSCGLSTQFLTKPCTPEEEDTTEYQVNLTIADLIQTQLEKAIPEYQATHSYEKEDGLL